MEFGKMFSSLDAHVAGEAYRIVTQSPILLSGTGLKAQSEQLARNFSAEKNLLLNEPRGHRGMHGVIPVGSDRADIGLLFFSHRQASAFKYEGVLAAVGALLETGGLKRRENGRYTAETTEGVIELSVDFNGDEVAQISVRNKAASVTRTSQSSTALLDGKRKYLIYPLPPAIPEIDLAHLSVISEWGAGKAAEYASATHAITGVVLAEELPGGGFRSVTFEKDGYILRSPGIDTTFALLALQEKRNGNHAVSVSNTSIFGSTLIAEAPDGEGGPALVRAEPFVTGAHQFVLDREDPLDQGFLIV
ncbi:proline racemase family protein [Bhargavaea beijingensis]|uniref:Proline racemase n=1 Tax=Bhargavaea beijingensis TaxID=426756 RepID=A0ABX9ZEW3_9BACL|nr:proline racemase family protein [Bhargavaea beijingensis]RSK35592.1 proline racemase [Bhargavaea beijingensis]